MMKKLLTMVAVVAGAGTVYAQSTVQLFGIVDATFAHGSGSVSSKSMLTNSGYNSSRLGFRGTEDLGGGLSASFWLEAGVNNDDGSGQVTNTNNQASGSGPALAGGQGLTFNRRSTVSLASTWGEIRLGRDYTPQFWNLVLFDPFGLVGVGTNIALQPAVTGPIAVRASNSVGYFLPHSLGSIYGQVQYYLGENASNAGATHDDGQGGGVRLGWREGPIDVAVTTSSTRYATGRIRSANIGGQYNFGMARAMFNWADDRVSSPVPLHGRGGLLGVIAPVGVGEAKLAYSRYRTDAPGSPGTNKIALGYVHNLSKRTALYVTYARLRNSGGATSSLNGAVTSANQSSSGYDLGLRHAF
jgi:predicted porin